MRQVQFIEDAQHVLGPRADAPVLGEVDPANRAGRVDEKLRRPGDSLSPGTRARVEKIVGPDRYRLRIGKKRVRVSLLRAMLSAGFWRVHADRREANAARLKLLQQILKTPQLGVAERSPIAAIEDEQNGARSPVGDGFAKQVVE